MCGFLQKRGSSEPTAADERRSLCATSAWLTKSDFCAVQTRVPSNKSGEGVSSRGFTNGIAPALVSTPSAVSRNFAEAFLQVRLPNHGGLTLAALVHLRLCIVKVAIAPANVRPAMPGVRMSAPVAHRNAHASEHALSHGGTRTRDTRSGGHKPPCCGEPHLQKRFRSCPGTDVARNKSGAVSPPVVSLPRLHRRSSAHRRQSCATLRKRSCKCASRITADSRPPLLCTCVCAS